MERRDYKYDIALSFAVEDIKIATAISKALDRLNISNYLFSKEKSAGLNIKAETWRVYHDESKFAVILISKSYIQKKWAQEEFEVIETVISKNGQPYLIPIRIDDIMVLGLSKNIIYLEWNDNAQDTAITLKEHIEKYSSDDIDVEASKIDKHKEGKSRSNRTHTMDLKGSALSDNTIINGNGNISKN